MPIEDILQHSRTSPYSPDQRRLGENLSDLEKGIFATVAYRDVFGFPPSVVEIHRYLPYISCSRKEIGSCLSTGRLLDELLVTDGEYYSLSGRDQLFERRRNSLNQLPMLWKKIRRSAGILASLPYVRMVAVTGSLAADNPAADSDLDFMLLTENNHLWRTRVFTSLLGQISFKIHENPVCPNLIRSVAAMEFEDRRLYTAQELTQTVPVYGYGYYRQMMAANSWVREYLPNADDRIMEAGDEVVPALPSTKRALESIMRNRAGHWFERVWFKRKKIILDRAGYSPTTIHQAGHISKLPDEIEKALDVRLLSVGIDSFNNLKIGG